MPAKAFSPDLYREFDDLGKDVAMQHFVGLGAAPILEPFGRYGVDLAFLFHNQIILVEPEVRENWQDHQYWFPFATVHIPERKRKVVEGADFPVIFVAARADGKRVLTIPGGDVLKAPVVSVPNRYGPDNETFFDVPLKRSYHRTVRVNHVCEIPAS